MSARLPKCVQPDLEPGSVVQLRSGGHSMVIEKVEGYLATCIWSDKGRVRREQLSVDVLKRSTVGTDAILIIPGLNADQEELEFLSGKVGNA